MITRLCDLGWNVVDRDDAVEQHHNDENQQEKCKIVEKRIAHERQPLRYHSPKGHREFAALPATRRPHAARSVVTHFRRPATTASTASMTSALPFRAQ